MKIGKLIFGLVVCIIATSTIFFASCSDSSDVVKNMEPLNITLTRSETQVLKGVNKFTFDLLRQVAEDNKEKTGDEGNGEIHNFILSPQGAAWCLAMVANGVEPGSKSEEELLNVFGFENGETIGDLNDYSNKLITALTSNKTGGSLHIANAVYYKEELGVYKDFLETLNTFYNTTEFNNHTNAQIDKWVYEHTNKVIKNFGTDTDCEKGMFGVLNAINFEGEWNTPFDPDNTNPREFHNEDGSISNPETMSDEIFGFYRFDEICQSFKIPLKNQVFSIHFVLPTEGYNISDVIAHLNSNVWESLDKPNEYNSPRTPYIVRLPKFKLQDTFDLFESAKKLGLESFIVGRDLTRLCASYELVMYEFKQGSSIEFNETGVEIASATKYEGNPTAAMPNNKEFFLDEPFLFFITEESTGAILFAGKIGKL